MSLNRCIRIHHYGILWSLFTALKNPLCSTYHLTPIPQFLSTTDHLTVPVVSPFPECQSWIILYVAFSNWLLSLSNMQLRFLHAFPWFSSSFLLPLYIFFFGFVREASITSTTITKPNYKFHLGKNYLHFHLSSAHSTFFLNLYRHHKSIPDIYNKNNISCFCEEFNP